MDWFRLAARQTWPPGRIMRFAGNGKARQLDHALRRAQDSRSTLFRLPGQKCATSTSFKNRHGPSVFLVRGHRQRPNGAELVDVLRLLAEKRGQGPTHKAGGAATVVALSLGFWTCGQGDQEFELYFTLRRTSRRGTFLRLRSWLQTSSRQCAVNLIAAKIVMYALNGVSARSLDPGPPPPGLARGRPALAWS